jgi:hypothetical protein
MLRSWRTLFAGLAVPALLVVAPPAGAARVSLPSDFDGDGYADLVIGVPGEDVGTIRDAGVVNVLYGSRTGLTAVRDQSWSQDSPGISGRCEPLDYFGSALATGDFNRDGYADLAIASPNDDDAFRDLGRGGVNILYGSPDGLTAANNQLWAVDGLGGAGAEGSRLTTADFDGDGFADLAAAAPGRDVGGMFHAGAIDVVFGSENGLTEDRTATISRATPGVPGDPGEHDARLGIAVAAGDLNGDGYGDLAFGLPAEEIAGRNEAGAVNVVFGSTAGITGEGSQIWTQGAPGIAGVVDEADRFGRSLAIGDLDGDGFGDLVVGVPGDRVGTMWGAGAVNVIYGSVAGPTSADSQRWTQASAGVLNVAEPQDLFGWSLAIGDLDGDGHSDLAVGVPSESLGSLREAGAVNVMYGSPAGVTGTASQFWTQDSTGVPGAAEAGDHFGWSVAIAQYGRSRGADLAVGVPHEGVGSEKRAGMVNVLYGGSTGLRGTSAQGWSQRSAGVLGAAERHDTFGESLAP